jgi:hypothetical protein
MWMDGDIMKLRVTFHKFSKAPKKFSYTGDKRWSCSFVIEQEGQTYFSVYSVQTKCGMPTATLSKCSLYSSQRVKLLECETGHSFPAKIKNAW